MAKLTFALALLTISISISLCHAQLYIVEAGLSGKRLKAFLKDGFSFCPSKFSKKGFSIQCVLDKNVKTADIYVNAIKKMERFAPFYANANRGKLVYALKGIKDGPLDVKCMGADRSVHKAKGVISCAPPKPVPVPAPAPKKKPAMSKPTTVKKPVVTKKPMPVVTKKPTPVVKKPAVPKKPTPVVKKPAATKKPVVKATRKAPGAPRAAKTLKTKKDEEEVELPPVMVKEEPAGAAMKKTKAAAPVMKKKGADYCIYKVGTSHEEDPLPKGWEAKGTAVTYKPNSNYGGVEPKDTAVLTYKFTVKYTSTYAVSLDMGTTHPTEHNDVFVRCQGGFNAMKANGDKFEAGAWVKAYHNKNGRATQAFTKDHDAHALSTKKTFQAGMEYTCSVGARSTKTTIYGLVLFPCKAMECQTSSKVWRSGVSECTPQ